jgi:hypothetical protein
MLRSCGLMLGSSASRCLVSSEYLWCVKTTNFRCSRTIYTYRCTMTSDCG